MVRGALDEIRDSIPGHVVDAIIAKSSQGLSNQAIVEIVQEEATQLII